MDAELQAANHQKWLDAIQVKLATYEQCMCRSHHWSVRWMNFTATCPSGIYIMDSDFEGLPTLRTDIDQHCMIPSGSDLPYFGTGDDFQQDLLQQPGRLPVETSGAWSNTGLEAVFGLGMVFVMYAIIHIPLWVYLLYR